MVFEIKPKHIFSINNEKVIKNQLRKIEIEAKKVTPITDFDKVVFTSEEIDTTSSWDISIDSSNVIEQFNGYYSENSLSKFVGQERTVFYVASGSRPFFSQELYFSFPKRTETEFIRDVLVGLDKNKNNQIKHDVTYLLEKYDALFIAKPNGEKYPQYFLESIWLNEMVNADSGGNGEVITGNLPNPIVETIWKDNEADISATASPENLDTVSEANVWYDAETDTFNCKLKVLCGLLQFRALHNSEVDSYSDDLVFSHQKTDTNGNETGYVYIYYPLSVKFSFYGNTISLDIKDKKITIGSEDGKNTYSISGNELLQTSNSGITLQEAFGKTIAQQKDGKETAVILCSVEKPRNDTEKMLYEIGDQVIPYVMTAQQQERPMSSYADGKPKVFNVLGTNVFYDGAVWQELTLQEATDYYTESEV